MIDANAQKKRGMELRIVEVLILSAIQLNHTVDGKFF